MICGGAYGGFVPRHFVVGKFDVTATVKFLIAAALLAAAGLQGQQVGLIKIDGAIGPATATYVSRAIDDAAAERYGCLIIQLDTPGGLLDSTKEIVEKLFTDELPTVVYVAPAGANAASAGTFITLAADVAAMAPDTTIGAAHPISLTGGAENEASTNSVMNAKMESYASTYIEMIATRHHRNTNWARSAVRESASATAQQALELHAVDLIAADIPSLLAQLDGREIRGKTLHTAAARVVEIPMIAREEIFQMMWRPEVMFVLMLIAVYGIIGEMSHPGAALPGVVGAVALILALYMGSILPVNVAGVALILLALGLFVTDAFASTHGALTAGGVVSFFLGSLMLFNPGSGFHVSLAYIVPATILTALFFLFIATAGLRAQLLPVRTGRESMLGRTAAALSDVTQTGGRVMIDGEDWRAVSDSPIAAGQTAEIVALDGLTLRVKRK